MPLDKTKTIKQRRVEVYLPTLEARERWKQEAKQRGIALSDFVFQTIEAALEQGQEAVVQELLEMRKHVEEQQEEIDTLRQRNAELEELRDRLESALSKYRAREFLTAEPVKQIDRRLVKVLSEARHRDGAPRAIGDAEIRKRLQVDASDIETLKGLTAQMEFLELHGVVTRRQEGWTWHD